jgi:hypothetical protein
MGAPSIISILIRSMQCCPVSAGLYGMAVISLGRQPGIIALLGATYC